MRLYLGDLVDIQVGYAFRTGLESDPVAPVGVIQMKDLGDDNVVELSSLDRVWLEAPESRWVRVGDVVLRSRGDRTTGAIIASDPGLALVAAPLLRLRVRDERLLPDYLNWAIDQPTAQGHLGRHSEGSYIKMLRREAVEQLVVEVPSLERQQTIVTLARLARREHALCTDIRRARGRLLADVMTKYAEESEA